MKLNTTLSRTWSERGSSMVIFVFFLVALLVLGCTPQEVPTEVNTTPDVNTTSLQNPEDASLDVLPRVPFNQPFLMREGDAVRLAETNTSLTLRRLIYTPCAIVIECKKPTTAIQVQLADGEDITRVEMVSSNNTFVAGDYTLRVLQSDFQSHAMFVFQNPGEEIEDIFRSQ